jgi:hypothetical protein
MRVPLQEYNGESTFAFGNAHFVNAAASGLFETLEANRSNWSKRSSDRQLNGKLQIDSNGL